jgi:uncharacterized phiE125 gp8 family phage protein
MPYQVTTPPASEPVTLAEAKTWLKRDDTTADDTLISDLIGAARAYCERETGRALLTQTVTEYFDGWPSCCTLELALAPVASVTSVGYVADGETSMTYTTWATTEYNTDLVSQPARIVKKENIDYPDLECVPNSVKVIYVAGSTSASADALKEIRVAMRLLLAKWYENREDMQENETNNPRVRSVDVLLRRNRVINF